MLGGTGDQCVAEAKKSPIGRREEKFSKGLANSGNIEGSLSAFVPRYYRFSSRVRVGRRAVGISQAVARDGHRITAWGRQQGAVRLGLNARQISPRMRTASPQAVSPPTPRCPASMSSLKRLFCWGVNLDGRPPPW